MPRRNRVTPFGEIESSPARGLFMGNRGILHDAEGNLGASRWKHHNWVCCVLEFKSRKAVINAPRHYTQLFFFDEAVAFAAGHRPCAECRRADYNRFKQAWRQAKAIAADKPLSRADIDRSLHESRVERGRSQRSFDAELAGLPAGTFILDETTSQAPLLVWEDCLMEWSHMGYSPGERGPLNRQVSVLTPAAIVKVFSAGYRPVVNLA